MIRFVLNEKPVEIAEAPPSHATLLDFLRERGYTGSKEGCAEGECGACAVALVAEGPHGAEFQAVNSCLMMLPMADGHEIYSVEGLAREGALSAPQQAIAAHGGSQCGYCTPGFAISLFAEYHRPGRTGPCQPVAMEGNLCRCTGYRPLRDAALSLGLPAAADPFSLRLARPAPLCRAMSSPAFHRPARLEDCLALVAEHPQAKVVAGATDVTVESNLQDRRWPIFISLEALPELKVFRDGPDEVEIGAGLTLTATQALWTGAPAAAREWFPLFASPLIRNRATLGGNLATASPVGDAAPLLMALNASVQVAGPGGNTRRIPLDRFFVGRRVSALAPGEIIASVIVPKPLPQFSAFYKIAKRPLDDISTLSAAFSVSLTASGQVSEYRIAYGGMAATPIRVASAETELTGGTWNEAAIRRAQQAAAVALEPRSDHRGSAAYRLAVAQSLLEKFFAEQGAIGEMP